MSTPQPPTPNPVAGVQIFTRPQRPDDMPTGGGTRYERPAADTQPDTCTCKDGGHALLCPDHAEEATELMDKLAETRGETR